ncbi:MAG: MBL fold metallo-hydrolase [Alphaproteobacteria bacterium]|nr:MBL fold metallo-hydrolase [Alphaproteobacteria bacterium]
MIIKKFEFNDVFAANCYLYIDDISSHGFIIDPSAHARELLEFINKEGWIIEKILLTHSHLDHIGAVLNLADTLKIKYYGLYTAKEYLLNPNLAMHFTDQNVLQNIQPLQEGDIIFLNANQNVSLQVIATPGHTIDSVAYYDKTNNILFTGDTIFQSGIGRTDIPGSGGNNRELLSNIKNKILTLPDNTILYPGHGSSTTVKQEKISFEF